MPSRRGRGVRGGSKATTEPTMDSKVHSVNSDARKEEEEALYDRVAQRLIDVMGQQPEKKFGIERLKALGATEFIGTIEPKEVEKWLSTF